eukprot:SAG31_NODE_33051_length_348_cov_1.032129_1_plen_61_part_01
MQTTSPSIEFMHEKNSMEKVQNTKLQKNKVGTKELELDWEPVSKVRSPAVAFERSTVNEYS